MTEHPITLPTWGIRALDHGKSQFRVPLVPQPRPGMVFGATLADAAVFGFEDTQQCIIVPLPWQVGDHLWCREEWGLYQCSQDGEESWTIKDVPMEDPRPSDYRHSHILEYGKGQALPAETMPRWAARHVLTVTGLRVERVRDISEADAVAEGCRGPYATMIGGDIVEAGPATPVYDFQDQWQADHPDYPWPGSWVLVTKFER